MKEACCIKYIYIYIFSLYSLIAQYLPSLLPYKNIVTKDKSISCPLFPAI